MRTRDPTHVHVLGPPALEHRHRRQGTTAHRDVRQLVCASVRRDSEELRARGVKAAEDERRADLPLVLEQALLEHRHRRDHPWFPACGELVELHVGRDELRDELGVRRSSRTAAPDVVGDVVDLLAVLVRDDRAFCSTRIRTEHDPVLVNQSDDRRTRRSRLGQRHACRPGEVDVPPMVAEVEARLGRARRL